jgi:putative tryptophan/tyrosine transport system substrate-binding protein
VYKRTTALTLGLWQWWVATRPCDRVRRRDFIAMLAGSAAVLPLGVAVEVSARPVIGYLGGQSPDQELLASFHEGLNDFGYFEGQNLAVEYRWALSHYKQLPALAADLIRHGVVLIVTGGGSVTAKAAKEVTSTIPILFISGLDPIREHLVESYSRPGGNATGVNHYSIELISKRLELLLNLLPDGKAKSSKIALLINDDFTGLEDQLLQLQAHKDIAHKLGLGVHSARSENAIEAEFASIAQEGCAGLLIASDPLFIRRRALIVELASRYSLPVGYRDREFVQAGGLMSYGPSLSQSWRQIGHYAGRILDGAKPEDLPVMLPRKYELVINGKTAQALGLSLARILADAVI